jgi:hypothetical protein
MNSLLLFCAFVMIRNYSWLKSIARILHASRCGGLYAETLLTVWSRTFRTAGRTPDQQDAFATAEWLRRADENGSLAQFFMPELEPRERKTAEIEGWILGVA